MRILLVNKFHWLKGGSETFYFELGKMLKANGHEVAYFSMANENNVKTGDKEYFVEEIDLNNGSKLKALDVIYSKNNYKKMTEAIDDFEPDIIHVNNFQRQLSASIIKAAKDKKIPIVFTAHDLNAVCPASAMLNKGQICEKCLHGSKYNCFKNKCLKDSNLKSLLGSLEGIYYKNKRIHDQFDMILPPSNFVGNKLREGGIKTEIRTLYNFIDIEKFQDYEIKDENYAFYFGRLSVEKGINNLIEAFSRQEKGNLYIAGGGPEKENIIKYIKEKNLETRVKLVGFLSQDEVKEYVSKCSFVVVPSIWYENCPFSVLETLALGKPVIGARIGGIPELIEDGKNGFLYQYDNIEELKDKIKILFQDEELRKKMGKVSLKLAKEKYDIKQFYKKIMNIYEEVRSRKDAC